MRRQRRLFHLLCCFALAKISSLGNSCQFPYVMEYDSAESNDLAGFLVVTPEQQSDYIGKRARQWSALRIRSGISRGAARDSICYEQWSCHTYSRVYSNQPISICSVFR